MKKKLTLLFALLCVSMMGVAQDWTGQVVGHVTNVWLDGIGANDNRTEFDYSVNYLVEYNDGTITITIDYATANFDKIVGLVPKVIVNGAYAGDFTSKQWSSSSYTAGTTLNIYFQFDYNGGGNGSSQFQYTIPAGGGSTPDPEPAVTGICSSETYNSNVAGYDIHAKVTKGCNKYYLTISSATEGKTITGLVGDNMFCDRYCDEARNYIRGGYHMAAAGHYTIADGKVIFTIPSVGDPKMYTPLNLRFSDNQAVEISALNGVRLEPCSSEAAAECPDPEPIEIQDVNFALINNGAVAYASSGNAWEAIDGNDGSRWESAFSDPQWFIVDLGQRRIFNTVQIRWQTAYSRTFTIDVSNDGETWTTKKVESNYTGGGENVEYEVSFGENVTARYVRLHSTARDTQWGNSFYSFRVLLKGTPILTSVGLAANTTIAKVGEYAILTPSPKDQNNGPIAANLTYTVTPADAGHVTDNKYYPDKYGMATITVTASAAEVEVTSNSIFVYGVLSDNLALSADIPNSKVIAQSEITGNATDAFYAVDGNTGSVWQACRDLVDNQSNAYFTSYFTLDLGNSYAINLIAIWFDGAASDEYTIEFSANNVDWATGFSISQHVGNYTHQKYLSTADLNNNDLVRYVRFTTTKASTTNGWGMKMFEMKVYGTEASTTKTVSASVSPDATGSVTITAGGNPVTEVESGTQVTFTATPASGYDFVNWTKGGEVVSTEAEYITTITSNTALVANFELHRNVYCHTEVMTDDDRTLYLSCSQVSAGVYRIRIDGSTNAKINAKGNFNFVVNHTTDYSAGDYDENTGRGWLVSNEGNGYAQNTFAAEDYKTITFGSHYLYFIAQEGGNFSIDSHFPAVNTIAWNSTCSDAEAPIINKAEAEVLNETSVQLKIQATDNWGGLLTYTIAREAAEPIISNHASGEEFTQDVTGLTTGTEYTFMVTVSDGVNNANQNIVVTPIADNVKPVMGEASLVSKTWNSAIINVAATDNKGVTAYYVVEKDADYVASEGKITIEGLTAATAYTFHIKAKDAAGNISDNQAEVSFTTEAHSLVPTTAAPVPEWPANQVKAIYSPTYSANCNLGEWGSGTVVIDDTYGKKYTIGPNGGEGGYFGMVDFTLNCLLMEKLHFDIWVADDMTIRFVPIWGGAEQGITKSLVGQQWNSIEIDLTEYTGITNWSNITQMKLDHLTKNVDIWIANAYFYREAAYVDNEAPTNASASKVAEGFYSVQITAQAEDNSGAVSFKVMNGEEVLATGAAATGVATTITVNNLTPGTNYNFNVVAYDEANNEAEPVVIAAETKFMPAAAPAPDFDNKKVVAVFTDAMACAVSGIQSGGWGETTQYEWMDIAENDKVFYGQNFNFAGWHSWAGGNIDATTMQYLHVDIYSTGMTAVNVTPISPGHEGSATITLTPNAWTSYDVPLSAYDANDIDWTNIFQFKFMGPVGGNELMIDNVYFWKEPEIIRNDSWMAPGELGTICIPQGAVATGGDIYELLGKDENGKIVFATVTNNEMTPGKPYLFEAKSTAMRFYYTSATPASEPDDNGAMKGTFDEVTLTGNQLNNVYYFAGHALWSCVDLTSTGLHVPANRAWVVIDEDMPLANTSSPMPGRRIMTMNVNSKTTPTAIDQVNSSEAVRKVILDGTLYILRGEKLYDATGRLVK